MKTKLQLGEIEVSASFNAFGNMVWCSHWELADELVAAGLLARKYIGSLMNHVTYKLP